MAHLFSLRGLSRFVWGASLLLSVSTISWAAWPVVPLGVNISQPQFVDAMKTSRAWETPDGKPAPVDAAGWPLADARTVVFDNRANMPWNGPDPAAVPPDDSGTYRLSFAGQAEVRGGEYGSRFEVLHQHYDPATNTTTADVDVPKGMNLLVLAFVNTRRAPEGAVSSGVSGVRLIRPGYQAETRQVFTTPYLKALAPFRVLRLMDFASSNNYPNFDGTTLIDTHWGDRRLPNDATQQDAGAKRGVAWEYGILLANTTGKDLWVNVPVSADDDYVRRLATLLKATLRPDRRVYVEYSNEVWNWGFPQATWNKVRAMEEVKAGGSPLNRDGAPEDYIWAFRRYGKRTVEIARIFEGVFGKGSIPSRVRPVLVWQEGMDRQLWDIARWMESEYGEPRRFLYGLGNAPYYDATDVSSTDAFLSSLRRSSDESRAVTGRFTALAAYYGLKNVGYEGGTGSVDRSRDLAPQFAAHRDPRMAENLTHHVRDNWFAAGGDLLCLFTLNAVSGPYGAWGLLEGDISRLDAPKYRAASELAAMAPPPVTVGCALPARVSGQALLPVSPNGEARLSSGETLGPFLLRSERAGQYRGTLDGSQEGPDVRVEVWVDNRRAGVVSLPVSPSAGASGPVTVDLPAGLHGLVLRAAGTGGRALFTPESRITITRMM